MFLSKTPYIALLTFCVWVLGLQAKTATIQIFTDSFDWETIIKARNDLTYNTFDIQDNGFVSGQLRISISGQSTYSPDISIVASNVIDIRNYRKDDNGDGIYDILDPEIYYQDSFTGTESGTYYQNSSYFGSVEFDTTFFVTREEGRTDLNARITGVVTSSTPQLNLPGDITVNRNYYTLGWRGSLDYGRTTYQSTFTNNENGDLFSADSKIGRTNENMITLVDFPLPNASGSIINTDITLNRRDNLFHKQFVVGEITYYFRLIDDEDSDADGIPDISDRDSFARTIFVDDLTSGTDLGSGWRSLDWFGSYYTSSAEWLYHLNHGWIYPVATSFDSVWFYSPTHGWLWTTQSVYPWTWFHTDQGWKYYFKQTGQWMAPVASIESDSQTQGSNNSNNNSSSSNSGSSFDPENPPMTWNIASASNLEMIWVEPGTFMMGSPTTEAGRSTNETEHNVKFVEGEDFDAVWRTFG